MPDSDSPESRKPATFAGTVNLKDFMFQDDGLRRSARISGSAGAPSSMTPRPAPSRRPKTTKKPRRAEAEAEAEVRAEAEAEEEAGGGDEAASPGPKKRKRVPSGYAPPSTYAHLRPLPDVLAPGLIVLFVGLNPGIQTARTGHAYAHPSNLFWKLLFSSGVTPRLCAPAEDRQLPRLYSLGNTNIVGRPSRNGAELSRAEMDEGVAALEDKVAAWRPESVCVVGKSIWESIWRVRHGRGIKKAEFSYGWQGAGENMGVVEGEWGGARVFVASSTSGLAATLSPAEKQAIWNELGVWVKQRRAERAERAKVEAETEATAEAEAEAQSEAEAEGKQEVE